MKIDSFTDQEQALLDGLCERIGSSIANPRVDRAAATQTIRDFAVRANFNVFGALERSRQKSVKDYSAVLAYEAAMEAHEASQTIALNMGYFMSKVAERLQRTKREVLNGTGASVPEIAASRYASTPEKNWLNSLVDFMSGFSSCCLYAFWAEMPRGMVPATPPENPMNFDILKGKPSKLGLLLVHARTAEAFLEAYAKIDGEIISDNHPRRRVISIQVADICQFPDSDTNHPKYIDMGIRFPSLPVSTPRLAPDGKPFN